MADDFYREIILDHYKSPRGHGELTEPTATAEGQNPLCGDEVTMYLKLAEDGETIEEVTFTGHGCAISQASTSMLTEAVKGRKAADVAAIASDEAPLVELMVESGTPLTPVRLKCALLGLGVLKLALNKAAGTPLPESWAGSDEIDFA
jgi:nitrogen fixation NifU-like protein